MLGKAGHYSWEHSHLSETLPCNTSPLTSTQHLQRESLFLKLHEENRIQSALCTAPQALPGDGEESGAGPMGSAGLASPPPGCEQLLDSRGCSAGMPRAQSPSRPGGTRPPGSAGYTTAPAGGSPAGPQARAYATAALLTQFHRGPKSRDPSLGLPCGALPTAAPGAGPGSGRGARAGLSRCPGHSRRDERRRSGRQRAPAGAKLSPPARSGSGEGEPLPRLTASLYFCRAAWSFFSL